MSFPEELEGKFTSQKSRSDDHWYLRCPTCGLTFYLPKEPEDRTPEALDILTAHAEACMKKGEMLAQGRSTSNRA